MQFTVLLMSGIAMFNFADNFAAAESTTVVYTTSGPVQGQILYSINSVKYAAFKGIRYAKAPVGYLRFKPPVGVQPWTETLNATMEGSDCTQFDPETKRVKGSEDCLFINVFTPDTNPKEPSNTLRSVMVFFYGGGFISGSSSSEEYHPDYLLERNVVYVSMNSRLGALGYLNLGHPNATGNAAFKDQVLGLKWVQANIKKFGGNPKNITIFGGSSGSMTVGYHVISDASAGLFHGAISMSGVPLNPGLQQTPAKALSQAIKLGALLGTKSTDKVTLIKAFYNATAAKLTEATYAMFADSSIKPAVFPPFAPTIEDESIATDVFLSKCPLVKYFTGNFSKVPQIMGYSEQENVFYGNILKTIAQFFAYSPNIVEEFGMDLPESIITEMRFLLKNWSDELTGSTLQAAINITSDIMWVARIDVTQRLIAANNADKPVYYYRLSFHNERPIHTIIEKKTLQGVGHGDERAYIFYYPIANYSTDPTDPVARTIDRVSTLLTNFAKYGNPTPDWIKNDNLNVIWPNSGLSGTMLDIGTELTVGPRAISDVTKVLQLFSWPSLGKANGCVRENDQSSDIQHDKKYLVGTTNCLSVGYILVTITFYFVRIMT